MRAPHWRGSRTVLLAGAATALLWQHGARAQTAGNASGGTGASSSAGSSGSASASSTSEPSIDSGGPPALQAPIGTMLPPLGVDPTDPSLRSNLLNAFGQTPPPPPGTEVAGPAWQFAPQLTIAEEYTNNPGVIGGFNSLPTPGLRGVANQTTGSDFVTLIQPQIAVTENGDRLRVNLFYAPTAQIFAKNGNFDQVRQQFNGDVLGTLMPDLIYADLRGSVAQQPVFGGLGPINSNVLPPNQSDTISNVSISPYLARTFGGLGTLQTGIGYIYTATDAPSYLNQIDTPSFGLPGQYGSSWLADRRLFATFTTGEDFGRFQDSLANDSNFYDGSGPMRNGQRVLVTNDFSYAINRFVSGLGEIGYENLHYPNEGFSYVGGVWSAGAKITPNAVSSVTLEYRYIDGFYSPYVYGSWELTPRLRLFGGYSEGITSFDQDQQNTLLSGNVTATGAAASSLVAAPLLNNGAYSGSNQGLNHDRRLTATAVYLVDRDTITASFNWDRQTIVGNPEGISSSELQALGITPFDVALVLKYGEAALAGYPAGPQLTAYQSLLNFKTTTSQTSNNVVAGLSWHHDLTPTLTTDLYLGYTNARQAETTQAASEGVQVSAGLTKAFTERLTGRIGYAGTFFIGNSNGIYTQNDQTVTVSLTRKF